MPATFIEIIDLLGGGAEDGDGYVTTCPSHADANPSLKVTLKDDGRVLMSCRSQNCSFSDIVHAIGLEVADLRSVDAGGVVVTSSASGSKAPPTAAQISWLREFIDEAAAKFPGSPAAEYAWLRWGITEAHAARLGLGYTDRTVVGDFIPRSWSTTDRVTMPLWGFDRCPRGLQGRALDDDDETRWCSLKTPPENAWSRLGYFPHDHGESYTQLGEGPGDALSAWVAGVPAVFLRGTALAAGAIDTVVAGLRDRVTILAGDADVAGQGFNQTMGKALTKAGLDVRLLELPDGVDDVTAWREADPAGFARNYATAMRAAAPFDPTPPAPPPPPTPSVAAYMNTVSGNAQRLIDYMGGDLAYCPQIGRMVFEDGFWNHDELNRTVHRMSELTYLMLDEGEALERQGYATGNVTLIERGETLKAWAARSQNQVFDESIKRAEKLTSIAVDRFDTHRHLLNVKNGCVDLRTATLKPHDRDDLITYKIGFDYHPDATCPRWDQFLEEVFPTTPEIIPWFQRVIGYASTGETVEQCLIITTGKGANGKSVALNTINHVLEPITGVVPFSAFEKKSPGSSTADLASLRGKRLALVQESESNTRLAESVLKRATGGDRLSCRNLYRSQMSFIPEFLILMATNSLPQVRGADEGVWRRMRIVPFTRYFADHERDPYLLYTLQAEAEGVLAWLVRGAVSWYESGLGDPPIIKSATATYRHTSDELSGFVGEVIVADDNGSICGRDLMGAYLDWTIEENTRAWSRRALYEAIVERVEGAHKVKRRDGVHIVGIRMATDDDRRGDETTNDALTGNSPIGTENA